MLSVKPSLRQDGRAAERRDAMHNFERDLAPTLRAAQVVFKLSGLKCSTGRLTSPLGGLFAPVAYLMRGLYTESPYSLRLIQAGLAVNDEIVPLGLQEMETALENLSFRRLYEKFRFAREAAADAMSAGAPPTGKGDALKYLWSAKRWRAFLAFTLNGLPACVGIDADSRDFGKDCAATLWAARRIYGRARDDADPDYARREIMAASVHHLRSLYPEDPYPWPLIAYHLGIGHDAAHLAAQRMKRLFLFPGGAARWEEFLALRASVAHA